MTKIKRGATFFYANSVTCLTLREIAALEIETEEVLMIITTWRRKKL